MARATKDIVNATSSCNRLTEWFLPVIDQQQ